MKPQHQAIAAGLALTLAFGSAAAPSTIYANTESDTEGAQAADGTSDGSTSDAGDDAATGEDAAETLPEPGGYDRALDYEVDPAVEAESEDMPSIMMLSVNSLMASRAMSITPTSLSSEMKYFAENESGSNYDQGFSYYDGYNAMGFYQFDRRYSLLDFMEACYAYDPDTYAMFEPVIERGDELVSGDIYDSNTKRLTKIGQLAQDAWHAAYDANPSEFSALQDNFAYQEYYLPVERILRNKGVDISERADCVKGLAWGLCNLFGSGGCQKFFDDAELSDDMTDREFVNALCDAVVKGVYTYDYAYADSYASRYERERATCLEYISEDEQDADNPQPGEGGETPGSDEEDNETGSGPSVPSEDGDKGSGSSEGDKDPASGGENDDSGSGDEDGKDPALGGEDEEDSVTDDEEKGPDPGDKGDDSAESDGGSTETDGDGETDSDQSSDDEQPSDDERSDESEDPKGDGVTSVKPTPQPPANNIAAGGSPSGTTTSGPSKDDGPRSDKDTASEDDGKTDTSSENKTDDTSKQVKDDVDGDSTQRDADGGTAAKKASDKVRATAEPETLPATADAATIGLIASAGLSAIGGGAIVAGGKTRRSHDPFEDGFRE
ncbi:hypothetical protein [Collinsella tanakaei]|uniref:VgrG-related protein n=1 Tax=Collinsella tanakaei TaxID=626935 RepID=UPI0025A4BB63|nr:hypothetical protein [Collinsella tanakaei]MDM8302797.1 hypothetical protein [Collinsella tanakaei]